MTDMLNISSEIFITWWPEEFIDGKSAMFKVWCHATRQQAITWNNFDQSLWCHQDPLGANELIHSVLGVPYDNLQHSIIINGIQGRHVIALLWQCSSYLLHWHSIFQRFNELM